MADLPPAPPLTWWAGTGTREGDEILVGVAGPASQNRLTVLIRYVLTIPHLVILVALGAAAEVVVILSWFAALAVGHVPAPLAGYLAGYLRWTARVDGYLFMLTDEYPPFVLADVAYPVRVEVAPGRLNRASVLFRGILAIPAGFLFAIVSCGAGTVAAVIAWLIVLVFGRMPGPLHEAYAAVLRYTLRVNGYLNLLTGTYPSGLFGDKAAGTGQGGVPAPGSPFVSPSPGWGMPSPSAAPPFASPPAAPASPPAPGAAWGTGESSGGVGGWPAPPPPTSAFPPAPEAPSWPAFPGPPAEFGGPRPAVGETQPAETGPAAPDVPSWAVGGEEPPTWTPPPFPAGPASGTALYGQPAFFYPGDAGTTVMPSPQSWRMVLSPPARWLMAAFVALGTLLWAGLLALIVSVVISATTVNPTRSAVEINSAHTRLLAAEQAFAATTGSCTTLSCAKRADAKVAAALGSFHGRLLAIPVPASSSAAELSLESVTARLRTVFHRLSTVRTALRYESVVTSSGVTTLSREFDLDYQDLMTSLGA